VRTDSRRRSNFHGVVQIHDVDFANHRVQQGRLPHPPAFTAGRTKSFNLPKQKHAQPKQAEQSREHRLCATALRDCFLRKSSSAISGFRSLCGQEQHSSGYCARLDLRFGTFHSAGSRFENSGLHPIVPMGAATLDRCCERNVVAPGQYSKWFFCVRIGLYLAILRPATALWMPARSALGAPAGVNPAAVIKAWIWPL
jgi:hypothetical protein